jgi:hypothetical protein
VVEILDLHELQEKEKKDAQTKIEEIHASVEDAVMEYKSLLVKDCKAIDSVIKVGDTIRVKNYCDKKKTILCVIQINQDTEEQVVSNPFLNELLVPLLTNTRAVLEVLVGPKKNNPKAKKSYFTFNLPQLE